MTTKHTQEKQHNQNKQQHWQKVYENKTPSEVSWTQTTPTTSLEIIRSCNLQKTAKIIDVGGGDSTLVDCLLDAGFENITVLDISSAALEKAKKRLGNKADKVEWIVCDITKFVPTTRYDFWHDRAAFHFLTKNEQIQKYVELTEHWVQGFVSIATFAKTGPTKCSNLAITQYDEQILSQVFAKQFDKIHSIHETHTTPFNTTQDFVFCVFKKKG